MPFLKSNNKKCSKAQTQTLNIEENYHKIPWGFTPPSITWSLKKAPRVIHTLIIITTFYYKLLNSAEKIGWSYIACVT